MDKDNGHHIQGQHHQKCHDHRIKNPELFAVIQRPAAIQLFPLPNGKQSKNQTDHGYQDRVSPRGSDRQFVKWDYKERSQENDYRYDQSEQSKKLITLSHI